MREYTYQLSRDVTLHNEVELALTSCGAWQREFPDDWDEICEWGVSSGWTYNETLRWLDETHNMTIAHFDQRPPTEVQVFNDEVYWKAIDRSILIMAIDAAIIETLKEIDKSSLREKEQNI